MLTQNRLSGPNPQMPSSPNSTPFLYSLNASEHYVKHRVDGIGMDATAAEKGREVMLSLDRLDHPDFVHADRF